MLSIPLIPATSAHKATACRISWGYFRIPLAVLLGSAALVKIQDVATILAADGLLANEPLLFGVIAVEAALACYLLLGDRRWSWWLAVVTFSAFALASGYAWASGQDCNCLSRHIGPGWMFALDFTVLALLIWFRPRDLPIVSPLAIKRRWLSIAVPAVAALVSTSVAVSRLHNIRQAPPVDYLFAEMWKGKSWPLVGHLDQRFSAFERGHWLVVIVRPDCEHCRHLIEQHFADPTIRPPDRRTAVMVADPGRWRLDFDRVSLSVSEQNAIEWIDNEPDLATPAVFQLVDGHVTDAADGARADELCGRLLQTGLTGIAGGRSYNTVPFR